jgi:hypothetical protein
MGGESLGDHYALRITSAVALTLPAPQTPGASKAVFYRAGDGSWKEVKSEWREAAVTLHLDVADLKNGQTFLVLGKPEWLNLNDDEPPTVVRFQMDGKELPDKETVTLGWLAASPQTLALEFRDKLNPIKPASVKVVADGRILAPGAPGVRYEPRGDKGGLITCDVGALLTDSTSVSHSVALVADDYAIDDKVLRRSVTFQKAVPARAADGTIITVDSCPLDRQGWSDAAVLMDGRVCTPGATTAGVSWHSDDISEPHWVELAFPSPRTVKELTIQWAYYEVPRASVKYEIQRWDGAKWVLVAAVDNNPEAKSTTQAFAPLTPQRLRIWQPAGGGHPGRANLMWIAEIEVK